jgi:gamma-glutamyltranspeptidase/glutathione hydrolase
MTDFSALPSDAAGPIANRVQPLKRPRSSMAPTLIFKRRVDGSMGGLWAVTGSPGGATIIQFVTKTVIGLVDWDLDAQQATSMLNFGAANSPTTGLGGEHPLLDATDSCEHDALVIALRARGHTVSVAAQSSGVATIVRIEGNGVYRLQGGADPRREGLVLAD